MGQQGTRILHDETVASAPSLPGTPLEKPTSGCVVSRERMSVCVGCRYSLQGHPVLCVCPECGLRIDENSRAWYCVDPFGSPKVVGMPYVAATLLLVLGACAFYHRDAMVGRTLLASAYAVGLWRYWIWRRARASKLGRVYLRTPDGLRVRRKLCGAQLDLISEAVLPRLKAAASAPSYSRRRFCTVLWEENLPLPSDLEDFVAFLRSGTVAGEPRSCSEPLKCNEDQFEGESR